ncbi:MAG: hypothetical protein HY587_05920 [Candidatus Omnitrophica bacterium]|nr:hypothetical protein [Candidatus Omnitrophota bacterium]
MNTTISTRTGFFNTFGFCLGALLLICTLNASCASEPKTPKAPPAPHEFTPQGFSLDHLRAYFDFQHARIQTLQSDINIRFADIDESAVASNAVLAYKYPDRLYIRGLSKYIPKVFLLVVRGKRFWLHIPRDNIVVTGNKEKLMRPTHIDLEINGFDILTALIVQPLGNIDSHEKTKQDGMYLINDYTKEGEMEWRLRSLWMDAGALDVTREEHFTRENIRYLQIERGGFYELRGWRLAKFLTIERPLEQKSAVITFFDTKINIALDDELFNFTPPPGAKVEEF